MGKVHLRSDFSIPGFASTVLTRACIAGLCGKSRPGHGADGLAPAYREIRLPHDRAAHTLGRQWQAHKLQVCRQGSLVSRWPASAMRNFRAWLREDESVFTYERLGAHDHRNNSSWRKDSQRVAVRTLERPTAGNGLLL